MSALGRKRTLAISGIWLTREVEWLVSRHQPGNAAIWRPEVSHALEITGSNAKAIRSHLISRHDCTVVHIINVDTVPLDNIPIMSIFGRLSVAIETDPMAND